MANGRMRELAWFFCDSCGARVLPHTKFDAETEAPEAGVSGDAVLLSSYNNTHREDQIGWCLSCKRFVKTERLGEAEIWTMYLSRRGVSVRTNRLRELKMVSRKVVSMNKRRFIA